MWPLSVAAAVEPRNRRDLELHAIDALKRYCAAHPCVNADLRGMVIAV